MLIKNNNKRKFFLVGANVESFDDCTLKVVEIFCKSDCIIVSSNASKSFIEKLKKIHYRIYFENDLKINHLNYRQFILDLFEINNTITHVRDGDPIFFNDGMSDYNFFSKEGVEVNIESGLLEFLNILNKNYIPITDRKINSSVEFISLKRNNLLNGHLNRKHFTKKIIHIKSKKNIDLIFESLYQYLRTWKITFIINKKLINFSKEDNNNLLKALKNTVSNAYLLIEKNEKI